MAAGVHTAGDGLALRAGDRLPTHGTLLGHLEGVLVAFALLEDGTDDLRDHIPRPLDHHGVADEDALLFYVVLVVQRGARDRYPADVHRLEHRLRRQSPGAPDVDNNVNETGAARERLELVRYRPARRLGDRS
jgi:hypothetical protein